MVPSSSSRDVHWQAEINTEYSSAHGTCLNISGSDCSVCTAAGAGSSGSRSRGKHCGGQR